LAKQSVREQIFDVGHQDAVKEKLHLLLTSERLVRPTKIGYRQSSIIVAGS
jgi:hypothetical protein